jgi:DNA-binding response OmpR family regulator
LKILLVEDELELASSLKEALGRHNVVVDHVTSLMQAAGALADYPYDVVVLDRQLSDGDALSLLKQWRTNANPIPVIILSARGDLADRVTGLDAGADDYLAKPFEVSELFARIRALVRRPLNIQHDLVSFGRLVFDYLSGEATVGGKTVLLTRRETLVLELLLRRFGRVIARGALMEAVFSIDDEVQPNALETHVSRLRKKLLEADSGLDVTVVRGVGYFIREKQ